MALMFQSSSKKISCMLCFSRWGLTEQNERKKSMVTLFTHHFLYSPFPRFFSPPPYVSSKSSRIAVSITSSSSPMDQENRHRREFIEFPHLSAPHRNLMIELVTEMETRLDTHLLPSSLPPHVQFYQNQSGNSQGSLHIRSGNKSSNSPIDFMLGSWLHCELPSGAALDISSLSAYLNTSTDAPNFLIELIRNSPSCLILILDLPPRKDLALHPDYLDTFYGGDTQLDSRRQQLEKITEVRPYYSSSLYIRCVCSPTAILVRIESGETGGEGRLEEIIGENVGPIAKEVLGIWLDRCAFGDGIGRDVGGETEREILEKRDRMIKSKTIEIDLGSNLPRLFGSDVGSRVMEAIQEVFKSTS